MSAPWSSPKPQQSVHQTRPYLFGQCDDVWEEVDFKLKEVPLASLSGSLTLDGEDAARHTKLTHLHLQGSVIRNCQVRFAVVLCVNLF